MKLSYWGVLVLFRMCDSEEIIHICVQIVRALVSYTCFLKLALPGRPQMIARFTQFIAG